MYWLLLPTVFVGYVVYINWNDFDEYDAAFTTDEELSQLDKEI